MKKILTVVFMATVLLMVNNQLEAQTKIGWVNQEELYSILPSAKRADSILQQYQEVLKKTGQDYQDELEQKAAQFNKDSATMTPLVRETTRKKLQDLYTRVVNYNQEAQQQLQQKQQDVGAPLQKEILDMLQKVAKENGYTYVMSREALYVAPDADNLLPLIKKKYNLK